MPIFNVKAPDGSVIPVNAPEGATEQDAIAFAASVYQPKAPVTTPSIPSKSEALPEAPAATDEELAAAARPSFGNPNLLRQGESMRAQRSGSVMTSKVPTIAPESKVIDPEFINRVQANLDALPVEQRADALKRLSEKDDVYGKAAKIVADRYAAMDQAPQIVRDVGDFRAENQVSKFTKQGSNLDAAQVYARTQAQRGQPTPQFQQLTSDVVGERADKAAAEQKQSLADAGFAERVGAGMASQAKAAGYGLVEAYADLLGTKLISKAANEQSRIGAAETKAIPRSDGIALNSLQSAMTSLGVQAPFMALSAVTGAAAPALAFAAISQFGQSYADGKQAGLTPGQAFSRAVPMAAAEVFFEKFGMTKALAGLKAHVAKNGLDTIPAYITKSIATEIPAELATTATQYLVDVLPEIGINKNPSLTDLYKQLEETLRQTVLQSGVTAGVTSGGGKAYQAAKELQYRTPEDKFAYALQQDIDERNFIPESAGLQAVQRLSPDNAQLTSNEQFDKPASPVLTGQQPAPLAAPPEAPLVEPPAPPVVAQNETPDLIQADRFEKPPAIAEPTSVETPAVEAPVVEAAAPVVPLYDRIGNPTGPAQKNAASEILPVDEAILLKKMIVKTVDNGLTTGKTRQQIIDQLIALTKDGIKPTDLQRINDYMTERGVKEEEPAKQEEKTETGVDLPIVYPLVGSLKISKDVAQFKEGANEKGVVEPLGGTFEGTGVAPIQVWRRLNGDLEVISGRHRLDLAQRSGRVTIPAQIHNEADGFDKRSASILDAELNIRDGQGKVKDYVDYFQGSQISREEADSRGLLARAIGKRSYAIATDGSPTLVTALRGDVVSDEAAYLIAKNYPNNEKLHSVAVKAIQDGKTIGAAVNLMHSVNVLAAESDTTVDLFGQDDSGMREAEDMQKIAGKKQREVAQRLSAITGASKNPALAKAEGIDIKDPEAVKKRINELRQMKSSWEQWATNPGMISEIRGEMNKPFELKGETETEIRAKEDKAKEATAKAKREAEKADAERKAETERKDIENRSKKTEFNLTPTDEVTKEEQAAIDKKAAENELAGQKDIFGGEEDASPVFSALTTLTNSLSSNNPDTSAPGASKSTETMAMPGANISRIGAMFGSKLYGKPDNIAQVSVKELLQNSFDAIKEALEKNQITQGSIQIQIDEEKRTITVTDNGPGMPGSVMGKEFLELAGTVKGTSRPSGGLGVAKMLFVYENEKLEVVSLREGVVSRLETTGAELKAALAANPASLLEQMKQFLTPDQIELMTPMIQESVKRLEASGVVIPKITVQRNTDKETVDFYKNMFPSGSGTSVKVTVPETYIDQSDGKTIEIPFSQNTLKNLPVLNKSPLFDNIEVSVINSRGTNILPIGKDFPLNEYTTFANVKFNWGEARIYVTKNKKKTGWAGNTNILSNGLWQFDKNITDRPGLGGKSIEREFYIDVVPNKNVKPEDPGYPFELNRQNFSAAIDPDFSAIFKYISTIYKQIDFSGEVKSFGTVQYINDDGTLTAPKELKPTAPPKENAFTLITPGDTVEVRDGAIFINNRQVPELTQEQIKNANIDYAQLIIPQNEIDPNKVMVHDNTITKDREFSGKDAEKKSLFVLEKLVNKYSALYEITLIPNNVNPDVEEYTFSSNTYDFTLIEGLPSAILKKLQSKNSVKKDLDEFLPPGQSLSDAARSKFGGRYDNYLSTIGKVFYNLRRGLVDIDPTKYAGLDKEAIGISIDKAYYGVSIKIPFSGMFINPASTDLSDTPAQIASSILTTMIHELAHFKVRSHTSESGGAGFASEMQRILVLLRTDKQGGGFLKVEDDLTNFINSNLDIFNYLNKEFQGESYIPSGSVFTDASANKTTDEGRSVPSKGTGDEGGGRGIRGSSGERAGPAGQELQREATDTKTTGAEVKNQLMRSFEGTKVADEQGRPIVVYHGTTPWEDGDRKLGDFKIFDRMASVNIVRREPSIDTVGSWFSTNPGKGGAEMYSRASGAIYPVYLNIQKPYKTSFTRLLRKARMLANGKDDGRMIRAPEVEALRKFLKGLDFDGIQITHDERVEGDQDEFKNQDAWVVLESTQVKSAIGNNGRYDMSNPSILENIDLTTHKLSPDAQKILVERRQEYAKLRRQIVEINKKIRTTGGTIDLQKLSNELHAAAEELKNGLARISAPDVTAENFLNQARKALDGSFPFKEQVLSQEVFDVIQAAYNKEPSLLNGLRLSVREGAGGRATANFIPLKRIVTLFSGTSGTTDPVSVRHELAHSMEQMMTSLQRGIVIDAWMKDLDKRLKDSQPGSKELIFFEAVVQFLSNPTAKNQKIAEDAMPGYEYYQFLTPSEYWAVNAEPLLNQQLGGSWEKFKKAMSRLFEGLKKVFGFDNKYDIHKVFKEILGGDRKRLDRSALINFVYASNSNGAMLNNIQDDEELIVKYNRPNTPMVDLTPVRTGIVNLAKGSKDVFKEVVRDPAGATKRAVTGLDHALLRARNREIFFGAGLNVEDLARYKGEMRVSSGLATASVAVDNALRGWTMASQVIMNGGIEYNARNLNFVSVKKAMGMAGVYKAEMAIKKRIGNQLGTDIIQGYLEAKRSLSIKNEVDARQDQMDDLLDQLANMPPNTDPDIVEAIRADYEEAVNDLKAIKLVERKVSMSDAEISDFIDRESEHPELKDIMDNWTAVNQNMLSFWRQVGLLSQARYDLLSGIKDYVPWNRIMEGDATTSGYAAESSVSSSTKSMTNIGQEKVFKSGKPSVQTEFIAKAGQDTFQINPSTVVAATVAGVQVDPADIISAPNGQVRITIPIAEGDIVSFKANREIENIIDNMTRSVMRMTMNGLRQYAAMRIVSEYATRNDRNMIRVFPKVDEAEGTFNFVANGRNIVVQIKDKHIADAIYGLHSIDLVMFKPLIAMANILRRGITLSGAFQLKQVFKDAPTAAVVTGVKRPDLLIGGVFKGFVTTLMRPMLNAAGSKLAGRDLDIEPVVKILQEAGIGGFQSPSRTPEAEVKLRLGLMNRNVVSFVLKALDHIGDSSDMAQRVAVYKRVLKETGDEAQALYQAANVINFLHRGYGAEAQFLAKTVPFIGAYVNATDVVVQALAGGGLKGMGRAKALQRLAVAGGMITAFTLLYMMLVSGDPEYEELDDQTKARNFIIPGTKIYLPINTPVGFLFKATAEIAYNHFINTSAETPKDATRMKTALKEAAIDMLAGPEPLPPPVKVFMGISLNHDFFTGRKVVPPGLENIDASEQYNDATSQAGKFLSSLTGNDKSRMLNPIEADHVIKGLFGTAGAMAMWLSNSIGEAASTRPATPANQVPIIGAFTLPAVGRNREDLFYDLKQRVDQQYKTFEKQMERMKADKISDYTPEQQSLIAFHDYVSESTKSLDEFNSLIRFVSSEANDSQTPKEKREMIEDIQRAKSDILTGVENFRVAAGL